MTKYILEFKSNHNTDTYTLRTRGYHSIRMMKDAKLLAEFEDILFMKERVWLEFVTALRIYKDELNRRYYNIHADIIDNVQDEDLGHFLFNYTPQTTIITKETGPIYEPKLFVFPETPVEKSRAPESPQSKPNEWETLS